MTDLYYTPATLKSRMPALAAIDDVELADLIAEFTDLAEDYLGTAFTPRTAVTETVHLDEDRWLELRWNNVTSVTSISIANGTATVTLTPSSLDLNLADGVVDLRGCYTGTATTVYAHGLATASMPKALLRACREYVRACALADQSNVPRDVIYQSYDGMTTRYSTPDPAKGRPTGFMEVDRLLNSLPQAKRIPGIG